MSQVAGKLRKILEAYVLEGTLRPGVSYSLYYEEREVYAKPMAGAKVKAKAARKK